MVARWITRLQPFDFKIVHRPGKHHRHADGLSRRASRPCKRDTCPECAPLLHQVTLEEDRVRMVTPSDPYYEHFDGYLELVEDDASLFCNISTQGPTPEQDANGATTFLEKNEHFLFTYQRWLAILLHTFRNFSSHLPNNLICQDKQ